MMGAIARSLREVWQSVLQVVVAQSGKGDTMEQGDVEESCFCVLVERYGTRKVMSRCCL